MRFRLARNVQRVATDGTAMLFDQRDGGYFALNDSAVVVLDALISGEGEGVAVTRLVETYGIESCRAAADIAELTRDLIARRLLEAT